MVVGLIQAHVLPTHKVGDGDGDRPTDPSQTVDQDAFLISPCFIYKLNGLWEERGQILRPVVRDGYLQILKVLLILEHIRDVAGHVQNVRDAVFFQLGQVGRVFGAAQVEVGEHLDRERAGDGAGCATDAGYSVTALVKLRLV